MSNLTKSKQIFLYVAPFPALVCFKIWAAYGREPGSLLIAAFVLFAYCAFIIWIAYRWDKPTYFDWTVSVYFFVALISLSLWPEAAGRIFTDYVVTGIYA